MSTPTEYLPGVLRYGHTHAAHSLEPADLAELIHLAFAEHRRQLDEPGPFRIEDEHGPVWRAVKEMLRVALVVRQVPWQTIARHPLADRPWELIAAIEDRQARAEAYRLEIHYHEQTTMWMREQRGRWLAFLLDEEQAPTKISLAAELGVSRPTLDKWISL